MRSTGRDHLSASIRRRRTGGAIEKPISYYDTKALSTLEQLVDFDRINCPEEMRFSVGAVNVIY